MGQELLDRLVNGQQPQRVAQHPLAQAVAGSDPLPEDAVDPAGDRAVIRLVNVHKTYTNGHVVLANANLTVQSGSFLFITGPSGSGKSTLLKLLYGGELPTQGQVWVDGENVVQLRGDRLAKLRRRIGIVFQDYKLIPRRTVAENVAFVLWAQGYGKADVQRRLQPALKMVGLHHKAQCFPDELSGGEQQRASLARAIVHTPRLLLADEPTGNLDPDNSRQIMRILKRLNQAGITVLVTSHDEVLIRSLQQPVVQVRDGGLHPLLMSQSASGVLARNAHSPDRNHKNM